MLGRGTWNRTTVLGFGDLRTNRCTIPLYVNWYDGYYNRYAEGLATSILFLERHAQRD